MDNHEINMAIDLSPHPATQALRKRYASASGASRCRAGSLAWQRCRSCGHIRSDQICIIYIYYIILCIYIILYICCIYRYIYIYVRNCEHTIVSWCVMCLIIHLRTSSLSTASWGRARVPACKRSAKSYKALPNCELDRAARRNKPQEV
jgi:hypothetical protein